MTGRRQTSVARAAWLAPALLLCAGAAAPAETIRPVAYYFPRQESCTVMLDYQRARGRLQGLAADARSLELARSMLAEWSANAGAKCNGASKVTIMAVYIPGTDIYGRPDFGNRTNVMKLQGDAAKLESLGRAGDRITMAQVRDTSSVEVY